MNRKIIVTGFTAFPGVPVNPTEAAIDFICAQPDLPAHIIAQVLPVTFREAGHIVAELIRQHRPGAVLMFGVAAGRDAIMPERFALNINEADKPDNDGMTATGQAIVPDAPPAYTANLPYEALISALHEGGIPAKYSNHAGAYVCNHVFYIARHTITELGLDTWAGFVHVPMHNDDPALKGADKGFPLWMIQQAMLTCVLALDSHLQSAIMTSA